MYKTMYSVQDLNLQSPPYQGGGLTNWPNRAKFITYSTLGGCRTHNPRIKSAVLLPIELRAFFFSKVEKNYKIIIHACCRAGLKCAGATSYAFF